MRTVVLSAPPSLGALYVRAAATARLPHRSALSQDEYRLTEQQISRAHLACYQRTCGYPVGDVLPPTYLHVLAFPLSVALMTRRDFPLPVIGLVHLANWIGVRRPVTADEAVSFTVWAADLRPHPAGRAVDIWVEAAVDDRIVWQERSTYLRRETSPPSSARAAAGPVGAATAVLRVPGDTGRRYAAVSGDRNPLHLTALTARLVGFRRAIAHGMWLEARTLAGLANRLPDCYVADVSFKTPVFLPATVVLDVHRRPAGWQLAVHNPRTGAPHLTGLVEENATPI